MTTGTCIDIEEKETTNYPCLKTINNALVVLFTSPGAGTVVVADDTKTTQVVSFAVGEYANNWDESVFSPYNGKVVLQNTKE